MLVYQRVDVHFPPKRQNRDWWKLWFLHLGAPYCTQLACVRTGGVVTCNLTQDNGWWWAMEGEADSSFTDARIFSPDGSNILIDITQWPHTIGRVRWPFGQRSKWNTLQILAMLRIQSFKKKDSFIRFNILNQVKDKKNGDILRKKCGFLDCRWTPGPQMYVFTGFFLVGIPLIQSSATSFETQVTGV